MSKAVSLDELGRPVAQGAASVTLRLLDDVAKRRDRLDDPSDDDALHDFRVALRRLRSWLRAFEPHLDNYVRKRTRRRLSRLADASNAGRDAEVQLEWLREQRHDLSARQREGLDWLAARLESRARDSDARLRRRIAKDFARACRALGELQGLAGDPDGPSLARAAAALVRQHADDARRHLAAVHSLADERETHLARIAGKRLRYLLEPFAEQVPESTRVVERLQALQDDAGELHDAHVLLAEIADAIAGAAVDRARRITATMRDDDVDPERERETQSSQPDAEPGLLALGRRVRARSRRAFAGVEQRWLHGEADALLDDALRVADRLDAFAETPAPAARPQAEPDREIERHHPVREVPPEAGSAPPEIEPARPMIFRDDARQTR